MMSLEQIERESRAAARRSAARHEVPMIVEKEDIATFPPFPFPYLGSRNPRGYRLVTTHFVDSSGFGTLGEPALTIQQFLARLVPGHAYAVREAGEFQVVIAEYEVTGGKRDETN